MRNLQQFVKQGTGGGCDKERGGVIQKCVFETNAQRCIEIGVFRGSSLMYFAEALEDTGGKVVGIDPYQLDALKNQVPNIQQHKLIYEVLFTEQKALDEMHNDISNIIKNNNLEDTVKLIRDKSEDVYTLFEPESVDVLHIDGNHDYEYVSKDIILYLPLVKPGGYIIMDDVKWKGVSTAIKKHMSAKLITDFGSFALYQK
jgi:predicted O-methyltransferase YrrM